MIKLSMCALALVAVTSSAQAADRTVMLPIAAAFGEGTAFRSPMAIAVIGGLSTSTALSLLFVPVVFSLIDGVKRRLEGRLDKMFHGQHGHEEPAAEDRPA